MKIPRWLCKDWSLGLVLFVLALIPRLPGLRLFLITDEPFNVYEGARATTALLSGRLRETYWHFYPGVTMTWVDSVGFAGQWGWERLTGRSQEAFGAFIQGDVLSLLVGARLAYGVLTALFVLGVFLMARPLVGRAGAVLGALFLAFDPFFLAHSRVVHGDAPVAVFMGLSALAFFNYVLVNNGIYRRERGWLIFSGAMGGLSALTKAPGQAIALFVILVAAGDFVLRSWRVGKADWRLARSWLVDLILWGGVAAVCFVALWPAMWVDPVGTVTQMTDETFGKVELGHLVFFMGVPTLDPGPWFYPYVTAFRLTPVVLIGWLSSLLMLVLAAIGRTPRSPESQIVADESPGVNQRHVAAALFWLYVIGLFVLGMFSPKKQDRYLLPVFPFIDLLAAYAFVEISRWLRAGTRNWQRGKKPRAERQGWAESRWSLPLLVGSVLIVLHAFPVVTAYPYHLAYFNPLMGGLPKAVETTLVGWGEGMDKVATYLNAQPNAEEMQVAAVPFQTLMPYLMGAGHNFYTNDEALRADTVVLYISQVQRLAPSPEIVRYFQSLSPAHIVHVRGVPYAWIYPGPRHISAELPPGVQSFNVGVGDEFRLAGYELTQEDGAAKVILFWHALAPMSVNYTISVRLVDEDGNWLAQHDGWPVEGLLPTSQWRKGDYVRDMHSFDPADLESTDHVQVVVYDAASGQALGAPVDLTVNR